MRIRSLAAVTALAVASAPLLAAPAQSADTTLGETFGSAFSCRTGFLALQTSPAAYSAPAAGVLTSWSHNNLTQVDYDIALRVGRANSDTTYAITAAPAPATFPAGETSREPVRIPVQAGDVIGIYVPDQDAESVACGRFTEDYETASASGDTDEVTRNASPSRLQLNVSATLEPDADGDGYGDTTQDNCPTQAATQGACADVTAPQTTITRITAKKIKAKASNKAKALVTTTFKANEPSTFRCSVDGGRYKACSSPFKVKLVKGKHTVAVQATDVAGNVDKTPATAKVTVKRARK